MKLHKFKVARETLQPKNIFWKPIVVRYPPKKINPTTWEIYTQKPLTLKPGETKTIILSFGFEMGKGSILISLSHTLKIMGLNLLNEIILESVSDVVTSITNPTSNQVKIDENTFLCRLYYSI